MSPTAVNYDAAATVDYDCYEPKVGCLDRRALNYGCVSTSGFTACEGDLVTVHAAGACNFAAVPPPPPPRPLLPPGVYSVEYKTVVTLVLAGSLSDWDSARRDRLSTHFSRVASVSLSDVLVIFAAGSVLADITIVSSSAAERDEVMATLAPYMATMDAAQGLLGEALLLPPNVRGLEVNSWESVLPRKADVGLIVGACVGAVLGLALVAALIVRSKRRAMVVPEPASSTASKEVGYAAESSPAAPLPLSISVSVVEPPRDPREPPKSPVPTKGGAWSHDDTGLQQTSAAGATGEAQASQQA